MRGWEKQQGWLGIRGPGGEVGERIDKGTEGGGRREGGSWSTLK